MEKGECQQKNLKTFVYELCSELGLEDKEKISNFFNELISKEEYSFLQNKGRLLKKGMIKKAEQGNAMSRAPFGYSWENKKLVPAENFREVEEIFEEFLTTNISLRQLSKKHNLSVNGLKKILSNYSYLGKVRFDKQIHDGNHEPIISSTLFNHVQNKLKRLSKQPKNNLNDEKNSLNKEN